MRGHALGPGAVLPQNGGRAAVHAGALVGGQLAVDDRAHERVREPKRLAGVEDLPRRQGVGGARRVVERDPGEAGGVGQAGRVAEDRGRARELPRRLGEAREAQEDRAHHGLRRSARDVRGVLGRRDDPVPAELGEQLDDRNGLPPLTRWQAAQKSSSAPASSERVSSALAAGLRSASAMRSVPAEAARASSACGRASPLRVATSSATGRSAMLWPR